MRFGHLVRFVGGSLLRQNGRTLLTLVGVAVGATSLAFTLSLGLGLRAMVDREFETRASFWDVTVLPADRGAVVPEADIPPDRIAVPPGVTGERRDRLRSGLVRAYQRSNPRRGSGEAGATDEGLHPVDRGGVRPTAAARDDDSAGSGVGKTRGRRNHRRGLRRHTGGGQWPGPDKRPVLRLYRRLDCTSHRCDIHNHGTLTPCRSLE